MWLLLCVSSLIVGPGSACAAAGLHAFDATLSLTGSCNVSVLDPIPDPGACPGTPGSDHPSVPFSTPGAVATDGYGNIYVANTALGTVKTGGKGLIDIFSPAGLFITELEDPLRPASLAVDSKGNLYVANLEGNAAEESVVRYEPVTYKPAEEVLAYPPVPTATVVKAEAGGLALNPTDDRLFVKFSDRIAQYESASEGNGLIENFGSQVSEDDVGLAIDAAHGRIYASTNTGFGGEGRVVDVFELAAPHNLLYTIKGTSVPSGKFASAYLSLAVDEGTGHVFVYDGEGKKLYEFQASNSGASYLSTIEHNFQYVYRSEIGLDNGTNSPNGGLNPRGRYLYVPSNPTGIGHSYAFGPADEGPPIVESTSFVNVGEEEAEVQAEIEPSGLNTHYIFEFITEQQYQEQGESFAGARVAGEGEVQARNTPVSVSAPATGLSPGTPYRFRVVATNEEGEGEGEGDFATYPATEPTSACPNEVMRSGPSALLPDCRAYELVSPSETNARAPRGAGSGLGLFFISTQVSPTGEAASFIIEGGTLPGVEAVGSFAGDPYLVSRGDSGWSTEYAGPSGAEASSIEPGSSSPDQKYSFWLAEGEGSAVINRHQTTYVRYPDGHSELVGRGSSGTDPEALGKLISKGGGHIVFSTSNEGNLAAPLTPDAPPEGTPAVYDRTADEVTHVASLLPGDVTPVLHQGAVYEGASLDGKGIAFTIEDRLYLRYEDTATFEVGENVTFEGVAEGGSRIFYLQGGDLWRLDVETGVRIRFTSSGDVIPVNVAAEGSVAYFVSPTAIHGGKNPHGEEPSEGKHNLYRSEEGSISFVGTVAEEDVRGEETGVGLDLWAPHVVTYGEAAEDPSRTTPDGRTLLFESHASLTGYDSGGHTEVYRYEATGNELVCLSCEPTLAPAEGDASLQSIATGTPALEPLGIFASVANLSPDGRRAVFQSDEALVPTDTDGRQDVYEWEAQGVGTCRQPPGCVYLISSGHSKRADYLYGVSRSGDDVFIFSGDILLTSDLEETPSIYDARVNGGFPEAEPAECSGEGCRPTLSSPPSMIVPESGVHALRKSHCSKGSRRVRRVGRARCVKKHHRKHRHRHGGSKQKGSGK